VIYYNATIASRVLERKQAAGDNETVEVLKDISPVAWQHVNLFGRFEFSKRGKVDLAALVKVFDEPQCWTRITQPNLQEDYTLPI
jgi:Tn3 transposase DDE domain